MPATISAGRPTYAGLFCVALSTLMYEILLTRIFSVTMWYHFAFVAVSIAMFGMTLGAVLVQVARPLFPRERTRRSLAGSAALFGLTLVGSFVVHLRIPPGPGSGVAGVAALVGTYALISIPFVFSGICVCLSLTRFGGEVSRLYACDLAGAAAGCLLLTPLLERADGPSAVVLTAAVALTGAACYGAGVSRRWCSAALAGAIGLAAIGSANAALGEAGARWIRLIWVKGAREGTPRYERWNSFSRIRVWGDETVASEPTAWGLSRTWPTGRTIPQLFLNIDGTAGTYLTRFSGDLSPLEFMKYDVTNVAHHLKRDARVLVVGAGGGRDVLAGLAFRQRHVTAVEINGAILDAVNRVFGGFTGRLNERPDVTFAHDEARSFVARSAERYDILQISLIDTWAATAAGAFVLSENALYTVDAWETFLSHLSDDGILTVSRWFQHGTPGETYRIASLANAALRRLGVRDPRRHLAIVLSQRRDASADGLPEIATLLVRRTPFPAGELAALEALARRMEFVPLLTPDEARDDTVAKFASTDDPAALAAQFPIDLSPPTDDRPFFFNMARMSLAFQPRRWGPLAEQINLRAVTVLAGLLAAVVLLTAGLVVAPALVGGDRGAILRAGRESLYFAAIGLGFMLIEIAQMQRLLVLLGHPTYSLSVVLFSLLVCGGVGSALTTGVPAARAARSAARRLMLLMATLAVIGLLTPRLVAGYQSSATAWRIVLAVALLAPAGVGMGMAFPLGLKAALEQAGDVAAWLWALNGALSVVGSVLGVVIAMAAGISATWWCGTACYALAWLLARSMSPAAPPARAKMRHGAV